MEQACSAATLREICFAQGRMLTLLGGGCELLEDTLHIVLGGKTHRIPCGTPISNGFVPINGVLAQSGFCTAEQRGGVVVVKLKP